MADDNTARFRSSDPYGRGTGSSAPANDPLAELARLIGQNDPFAEFGQENRQQENRQHDNRQPDSSPQYGNYPNYDPLPPQHAPEPHAQEPAPYGQDHYNQDHYSQAPYSQAPAYDHQQPEQRFPVDLPPLPRFSAPQPQHDDWPGSPTPAQSYQPRDPFPQPPQHLPPVPGFDTPAYADHGGHQNYQDQHSGQNFQRDYQQDFQPERPSFDPPPSFLTADRPPPFMQPSFAEAPVPVYPAAPEAGAMPAPHDDEFYDDAPRPRRRKGLLTVAAVLALAVVGTASAVGYRSFFGGPGKSSPPPVIRASAEPNKVAPPQSTATDPSASKFNYDRFADRGKDEQVVKREETPVDPRELQRSSAPRVVAPGAPVANSPSSRTGTTATANPPSAIGEPRRVRTVPIKPDANDMASNIPSGSADPLPPPPPSSRQASAAPATRPADPPPRAAAPQTRTESRIAAASRNTPAPSANAPLSLSPEANNSQLSVPPPAAVRDLPAPGQISAPQPQRQANVAPAAPAPRSSAGGRFHVQVSSQKSEADAQASLRSIQSRYSSVLGGQPHVVRRADLGAKGVYYRAMVGPFGSREEAVQLCSSLKSAGGDCVVQAN